jgi:hypothetical protein
MNGSAGVVASVADIVERELPSVIEEWLIRVEKEPELIGVPINREDRTGHLPHLLHHVVTRLRVDARRKAPISTVATEHGDLSHKQG